MALHAHYSDCCFLLTLLNAAYAVISLVFTTSHYFTWCLKLIVLRTRFIFSVSFIVRFKELLYHCLMLVHIPTCALCMNNFISNPVCVH